jgi:hypothetical protein
LSMSGHHFSKALGSSTSLRRGKSFSMEVAHEPVVQVLRILDS